MSNLKNAHVTCRFHLSYPMSPVDFNVPCHYHFKVTRLDVPCQFYGSRPLPVTSTHHLRLAHTTYNFKYNLGTVEAQCTSIIKNNITSHPSISHLSALPTSLPSSPRPQGGNMTKNLLGDGGPSDVMYVTTPTRRLLWRRYRDCNNSV